MIRVSLVIAIDTAPVFVSVISTMYSRMTPLVLSNDGGCHVSVRDVVVTDRGSTVIGEAEGAVRMKEAFIPK